MIAGELLAHDWFKRPLPPNVAVGEGSWLYSAFAFLHFRSNRPAAVRIGAHSGVYLGSHFELGPSGEVAIGDYCSIVGAIIVTNRRVQIDEYAFIAHQVVIADDPFARPFEPAGGSAAGVSAAEPIIGVHVGRNAWIGARATLLGSASIGEGAIVGAAAVVSDDVPDFAIAAGNPARVVGWARPEATR